MYAESNAPSTLTGEMQLDEFNDLFFGHLPIEVVLDGFNNLVAVNHPAAVYVVRVVRGLFDLDGQDDNEPKPALSVAVRFTV